MLFSSLGAHPARALGTAALTVAAVLAAAALVAMAVAAAAVELHAPSGACNVIQLLHDHLR